MAESLKEKLKRKVGRKRADQDLYYKNRLTDVIGITFITVDYKRLLQVFITIIKHTLSDRVHAFKKAPVFAQIKPTGLPDVAASIDQDFELTDIKIYEIKVYINDKYVYKSKNTLLYKIYEQRKNKKITNPLLMGLLEMYKKFSKRKIGGALAKIKIESKPNAYEGIHIILKVKFKVTDPNSESGNKLQFTEYVEIQCRTFAQSIWYLHEHKNNYKKGKVKKGKVQKNSSEIRYHLLGTVAQLIDQILSIIFSNSKK